ncbi:MAG: hypothetical protein L6R40_008687 [Gallowayella cf. fulva]|nr:MAG: hypothetical protein L6R40_008687 [Xanthomendoza cf. fulva]
MHFPGVQSCDQHSIFSFLIPILLLIRFSHTQYLQPSQPFNCSDLEADTTPSCWNILGIPSWLSQFSGSNATCVTSNLTDKVYGWSDCLQLVATEVGYLGHSSKIFNILQLPLEERQRYRYVYKAMSELNGELVRQYMDAIVSNAVAGSNDISAILAFLDPERRTSFAGKDLYQAIMLGLPIYYAYNGTGIPSGFSLQDISGILLELIRLANTSLPNLPDPAEFTGLIPSFALPSALSNLTLTLSSGVQEMWDTLAHDLSTFLNVTANGAFVSSEHWHVPTELDFVSRTLNTFLVTSILAQQNWTVFALVGIDVAALSQSPTTTLPAWVLANDPTAPQHPTHNFGCTHYTPHNQCGRWWYSTSLHTSFTLLQPRNPSHDPVALLTQILTRGWTTGSLLFENAALCAEPPSLTDITAPISPQQTLSTASPITNSTDSWFHRLLTTSPPNNSTAHINDTIAVSEALNSYIETHPGIVRHPQDTLYRVRGGRIDFSCLSQLDWRVGWDWRGVVAGDFG